MKRTVYNRNRSYRPGVFIPRRDLFPDYDQPQPKLLPISGSTSSIDLKSAFPRPFNEVAGSKGKTVHRKIPKTQTPDPVILILLFFGGLLLWPRLRSGGKGSDYDIQSAVSEVIDSPVSLKILHAICPYLDDREQDVVFTITGIVEVLKTIEELMDRSYHMRWQNKLSVVPVDPVTKRIGIVKALKPYIPEVGRKTVENVLKVYDTFSYLGRSIEKYRSSGAALSDAVEVILPLMPDEYRRRAYKIVKAIKVAEAMELADGGYDKDAGKPENAKKTKAEVNMADIEDRNHEQIEKEDKVGKMVEALKPMLSDDQKGSIDVIMKMARLLSGPNDENNDSE